ncbi:hypothetical protein HI914_04171 [Erysiphe necator]|nr:hypothetical protein HI914_04171 [Erysiphe necator]
MAQSLPYSFYDGLPMIDSRAIPVTINPSLVTSSYQINQNQRKSKRWAVNRSVDSAQNDWGYMRDIHLSQTPFRSKKSQQSSSRAFQNSDKSNLLSDTVIDAFKNRNLPALPKAEDSRPRANSFEYDDESRFFSNNVIRRQQPSSPPPPSPPPKKVIPRRSFSHIVKSQTESKINKCFVAHPDSLVPGRSQRRSDVKENFYRTSEFQYNLGFCDSQKPRGQSSVPSQTSNLNQKNYQFSKSYSHPMMSRDKPWRQYTVERPSTSEYDRAVTSTSNKPLPFAPSSNIYQGKGGSEKSPKEEHHLEGLSKHECLCTTFEQNYDEIGWNTNFIGSHSEPKQDSDSLTINHTLSPKPQLPNLNRISLFGTDIFSQIQTENMLNASNDIPKSAAVRPASKKESIVKSNFDPDSHYNLDKVAGTETLLSRIESIVDNARTSSSSKNSMGFISRSGPHVSASEIKIQGPEKFPEVSSKIILQSTEMNEKDHEMKVSHSNDNLRYLYKDSAVSTKSSSYDDFSQAKNTDDAQTEFGSIGASSNLSTTFDHKITSQQEEKDNLYSSHAEFYHQEPRQVMLSDSEHVSIKNPSITNNILFQKTITKNNNCAIITKISPTAENLQPEKFEDPNKLENESAIKQIQGCMDSNTAIDSKNTSTEKTEKPHLVAQSTPKSINSDILAYELKVSSEASTYDTASSKKFEPPDHETVSEIRKDENSKYFESRDQPTSEPQLKTSPNYENKDLQQDIVRSLKSNYDDRKENCFQQPESSDSVEDYLNTYLPSEYDNYWASSLKLDADSHSIPNLSQLPNALGSLENNALSVAPLSPRKHDGDTPSYPESSIPTGYPTEDDNYSVSPISVLSPQSDFKCELVGNTPVSPISVVSDLSTKNELKCDLKPTNSSYSKFSDKKVSLELSRKTQFEKSACFTEENIEKDGGVIDKSTNYIDNASNCQSSLQDRELSYSVVPTVRSLLEPKFSSISPGQKISDKDLCSISSIPNPTQSMPHTVQLTSARLPSFRETLAIKCSRQKAQNFDEMRETFASIDIGLSVWIRQLKKQYSENESVLSSLSNPGLGETGAHVHTHEKKKKATGSNFVTLSPLNKHFIDSNPSSLLHSPHIKFSGGPNISNFQNFNSNNKLTGQQVQAKGKELFHTAGILSGKAGKAGMGLLAKGKSRLLSTEGDDKVDSHLFNTYLY